MFQQLPNKFLLRRNPRHFPRIQSRHNNPRRFFVHNLRRRLLWWHSHSCLCAFPIQRRALSHSTHTRRSHGFFFHVQSLRHRSPRSTHGKRTRLCVHPLFARTKTRRSRRSRPRRQRRRRTNSRVSPRRSSARISSTRALRFRQQFLERSQPRRIHQPQQSHLQMHARIHRPPQRIIRLQQNLKISR